MVTRLVYYVIVFNCINYSELKCAAENISNQLCTYLAQN